MSLAEGPQLTRPPAPPRCDCPPQNTKAFMYKALKVLVIDEADRMLEIGFEARLPEQKQKPMRHLDALLTAHVGSAARCYERRLR